MSGGQVEIQNDDILLCVGGNVSDESRLNVLLCSVSVWEQEVCFRMNPFTVSSSKETAHRRLHPGLENFAGYWTFKAPLDGRVAASCYSALT